MHKEIEGILKRARQEIKEAKDPKSLEAIRIKFLGRKGEITLAFKRLSTLSQEERPKVGRLLNEAKKEIESLLKDKDKSFKESATTSLYKDGLGWLKGVLDPSLPGRRQLIGRLHPITQVMDEICAVFKSMGFSIAEGPEVEEDFYNFEALNIPPNHPARDMQDTFYIDDKVLLRTHTSPIQIRTMKSKKPPIRIVAPGKVYRCDSDVTHTPMFHQVEGLMVDKDVSFSQLKGTLTQFIHKIFDPQTKVRFRPSYFPFTEPSAEVDIQCVNCRGKGCRVCGYTGWLEVLGAGMVHPAVFRNVGYDPNELTGFAFGLGVERIAMLKYSIDDIRLFYDNDIRFLDQF